MKVSDEGRSNAAHWWKLATERQQEIERLSAANEGLRGLVHDEIAANTKFREDGGALPDEDMPTFCARLLNERSALTAAHAALVAEVERLTTERDQWRNSAKLEANERKSWESRSEAAERDRDHYKARANEAQESAQFWIGEHNRMERQRNALTAELAQREAELAGVREDARRYRWLKANGKPAADGLAMRKSEDWDAAIDRAAEGKGNG